ncbi:MULTISPECIES: HesA/MoeB/ThiF family protein [Roseobacteraceae]|uniref:Molybdopterin-synthase adenylyltransferase n=1 Tax=Pseudosulfitobacter pseudonitzschiae TaxID=1402135 RepID=A0A221K716_9RHOB|nr:MULTISPECIES: HesA/MoeB/ThiF family protein [Roseobacteraceae]ASM74663.1 molybdopterin-synthase adenylyltransferase [Pseudosulfitobacter pseudonitzschiae]
MNRYARQTQLPEVGETGQRAIAAARVLVVGAGGLAAPVLQYLAGAGVGHLTLVDGDVVALSNLHRQTLFRENDVGRTKADVAAQTLRRLNGNCDVVPLPCSLDPANAAELVARSTLVLDCADSFAASYILSDTCHAQGVPLVSASVLGFTGYVGGFCGSAPSLRAVFPDLPDRAATCATAGVMGPVVGLVGAAMAQMALGILIGQRPSPLGQLMHFDMQGFRASGFRFDGTPEPEGGPTFIAPSDLTAQDFVVELRDRVDAPVPVTPAALRTTVAEYRQHLATPPDGQRAVFACRSGLRAWQAAAHLRSHWAGEISLIATGDTPPTERHNK